MRDQERGLHLLCLRRNVPEEGVVLVGRVELAREMKGNGLCRVWKGVGRIDWWWETQKAGETQ